MHQTVANTHTFMAKEGVGGMMGKGGERGTGMRPYPYLKGVSPGFLLLVTSSNCLPFLATHSANLSAQLLMSEADTGVQAQASSSKPQ